jgi:TRAP-type C4-dicarboxylate transport system substrate-binding protein
MTIAVAVRKGGVTVIEPDTAPFREASRPVWDRYLTTPELRALADSIAEVEGQA